jgi:hypothetical protein
VDNKTEHATTISTKKEIKFQNATLLGPATIIAADNKRRNHREEKKY